MPVSFRLRPLLVKVLLGLTLVYLATMMYYLQDASTLGLGAPESDWHSQVALPVADPLASVRVNSSNYQSLFSKMSYNKFLGQSLEKKCSVFFSNLAADNKQWQNDPHQSLAIDKNIFDSFDKFKDRIKQSFQNDNTPLPENFDHDIQGEYDAAQAIIKKDEQILHDIITNVRVFDQCYVESASNRNVKDVLRRVMPFLTQKFPIVRKPSGEDVKAFPSSPGKNFLRTLRNSLKGRGIVMTLSDDHVPSALKLIALLRHLHNKLPIQVVYFENLSDESIQKISNACGVKIGYPLQDVFFVDVSDAIEENYRSKFSSFGNKILATMFNSFKEMVFLDADTVVLKEPIEFFDFAKYKQNGTIFFKDRKSVEYRSSSDVMFFKKLLPSKLDTAVFGINPVTNYTLNRDFFLGSNHYMESGLVVLNREKHFFQPFMMSFLNFYLPVQARIYGDKELFWLALAFLGDENYSFNEHFSAAIGELTPSYERIADAEKAKSLHSQELCSNHPAHIDDQDDHTLLWFNSGFQHCGQNFDSKAEFSAKDRYTKLTTLKAFETFFKSKLIIKNAIVPPHKALSVAHTDGESDRAWLNMRQYCKGYTWCAYSSIGDNPKGDQKGLLINFTPEETKEFSRLGDVWMSA